MTLGLTKNRATTDNTDFASGGVACKLRALCFYSSLVQVDDKEILSGESVSINSIPINESAIYNWYDSDGNLIHEGTGFTVSPDITRKYRLEVITEADGFKDYDEMEVKVNPFWIESLTPNPAQNQVNVVYQAEEASSAYFMIMDQTGTYSQNYIIDTSQSSQLIDVTSYLNGTYTVILVCDGLARDAKNLVIQ